MAEIDDKFAALGGAGGVLGNPVGAEFPTADGLGRARRYERGAIYWTPATGAHEMHGAIWSKWSQLGIPLLGYPLTDETATPDGVGRYNHFQRGSIYWTPATGAWEVHGAIRNRWEQLEWERGPLGYPVSDEMDIFPQDPQLGRVSRFQGGQVCWDSGRGAYEVWPVPPRRAPAPATEGQWEVPSYNSGVVGVHAALLHTNQVLFFTYRDPHHHAEHPQPEPHGESAVLDLATKRILTPVQAPGDPNLFCAGQALLADGRLLVGGGERQQADVNSVHVFTPGAASGGRWQRVGTLAKGRWYPTCVTLHDGRVLILGGQDLRRNAPGGPNHAYEIYAPAAGLAAPVEVPLLRTAGGRDTYPFAFVLPQGRLLMHAGARTDFLDLRTFTQSASFVEAAARPGRNARTYNLEGTSVLLPLRPDAVPPYRARVMAIGGGGSPPVDMRTLATESCEILDTAAADPQWRLAPPMTRPRVMPDAVLLPDGKVFVSNGSSTGYADNGANPVYEVELYDPIANTWTTVATMTVPRLYHAVALLLPDGRVLTAGTDSQWNPGPFHVSELRLELYSPPYLFRGPRPVIERAPGQLGYGDRATIECSGPAAASACLIRCGSATHSFNSDQRWVGLAITSSRDGRLEVRAPPNGFVAPPGYYLLFLLTSSGIPSVATFVRLG
ncbi:MAG: galactose oxidase-like domain-containing protein [Egibacteraceae bacterium]